MRTLNRLMLVAPVLTLAACSDSSGPVAGATVSLSFATLQPTPVGLTQISWRKTSAARSARSATMTAAATTAWATGMAQAMITTAAITRTASNAGPAPDCAPRVRASRRTAPCLVRRMLRGSGARTSALPDRL